MDFMGYFMFFTTIAMFFLFVMSIVMFYLTRKILNDISKIKVKVNEHYSYIIPNLPSFRYPTPPEGSEPNQSENETVDHNNLGNRPKLIPRMVSYVSFPCDEEVQTILDSGYDIRRKHKIRESRTYLTPRSTVVMSQLINGTNDNFGSNLISELKNGLKSGNILNCKLQSAHNEEQDHLLNQEIHV